LEEVFVLSVRRFATFGAIVLSAIAWPATSQAQEGDRDRGVLLRVQGGGYSPLAHLDPPDLVKFKTGFNLGGSVGYQINRYAAVRGNFAWARGEGRDRSAGFTSGLGGVKFNRFLYDGDVQLRYPFASGVAPYVFGGGGAVTQAARRAGRPGQQLHQGGGQVRAGSRLRNPPLSRRRLR